MAASRFFVYQKQETGCLLEVALFVGVCDK